MQLIEGPKDQDTAPEAVPAQASSDDMLIALWLAGKADRTRRAYQDDVAAFLRFVGKPLAPDNPRRSRRLGRNAS